MVGAEGLLVVPTGEGAVGVEDLDAPHRGREPLRHEGEVDARLPWAAVAAALLE